MSSEEYSSKKEDSQDEIKEFEKEIKEFEKEKEKVKKLIGDIGGKSFSKKDMTINIVFLGGILLIFILEITTHFLPAFISLEIGVLLISIKIIWMIHSQQKVYHFQFWVLNSIEFRVNGIFKRIRQLDKKIEKINEYIAEQEKKN